MKFRITVDVEMSDEQVETFMNDENILFADFIPNDVAQWLTDDLYSMSELSEYVDIVTVETEELTDDDSNS